MEEMVSKTSGFWKGRRVLITGHTGFKGAWLTLWLAHLGARVTGLALSASSQPSLFSLAVKPRHVASILGDVRDGAVVREAIATAKPEVVFHLAAQALVRPSYEDPVGTYATNVMGTVHVLEAVRATGSVEATVIVTSDKCYENREWHWPYREYEPMGGSDPYSSSKGCAELVTRAYRTSFFGGGSECRVASARAGNVIGGGDWAADRLLPDMVRTLSQGVSTEIRNPGAIRPWQHVLEPLSGYLQLAERLATADGKAYAEGWNFGPSDEDCWPVARVADRFGDLLGAGVRWRASDKVHPPEAAYLKVDASKALSLLGWQRRLRLETALEWTARWYRRHFDGADAEEITLEQIETYEALEGPFH